MIKNLFKWLKKEDVKRDEPKKERPRGVFTSDDLPFNSIRNHIETLWEHNFGKAFTPYNSAGLKAGMALDNQLNIKNNAPSNFIVPDAQVLWYAAQSFIGYQLSAMMAQHWLISKCCLMPAKDATRNGYDTTVNDGTDVGAEVLDEIRRYDKIFKINRNLIDFVHMGRVFGIRIAMFHVDSDDPEYYYKPFNPDGIKPGSYRGISQIDPYWITPQLDTDAAGNPASIHFYEPTWWNISGKLIHRTHLIIFRTEEVPDILKPTYIYGGIPIPQKVYERVYAAERTANEAPMLAMTKRTDVVKADMGQALADEVNFAQRMQTWVDRRDNYGVKTVGLDEEVMQFDTSLTDLDTVIMTQYQIVAAAANVPATKLLGTTPKGFNATGEYEEASYHEELESIQTHDLSPLIERHHLILIRSHIAPKFNIKPFSTSVLWKSPDAMTAKELAELNKLKADTGLVLAQSGAIDGTDERERIINDPESGYNGVVSDTVEAEELNDLTGA